MTGDGVEAAPEAVTAERGATGSGTRGPDGTRPGVPEPAPVPRRRGRRAGSPDTRGRIVAAAQRLFARDGYDGTSMRAVAREAGVDPALVRHYFDDKGGLFLAAAQIAFDPRRLVRHIAAGGRQDVGRRAVRGALRAWESPLGLTLVRAVQREPRLYPMFARLLAAQFDASARELMPGLPEAELRARIAGVEAVLGGMFAARYVGRVEPLASLPPEVLVERMGPLVQRLIDGE